MACRPMEGRQNHNNSPAQAVGKNSNRKSQIDIIDLEGAQEVLFEIKLASQIPSPIPQRYRRRNWPFFSEFSNFWLAVGGVGVFTM